MPANGRWGLIRRLKVKNVIPKLGQKYFTSRLIMQVRFEVLATVSVRIWFPGMFYHVFLCIGTNILEEPATCNFRIDECVTYHPEDGGSRFYLRQ